MLSRIMGAFLFRTGVYEEVEKDTGFTTMAWIIVAVVAFLVNLAQFLATFAVVPALVAAVLGTIFELIVFAILAFTISFVGKLLFKAETNFSEMVRVMGLAYVWKIVGVLAILGLLGLGGIANIIIFIAGLIYLIAALIAVKAALDLDWLKTIVTVVIAFVIYFVLVFLVGMVIGIVMVALGLVPPTPPM